MHLAAYRKCVAVIPILLDAGVKFTAAQLGDTPLHASLSLSKIGEGNTTDALSLETLKAVMKHKNSSKFINERMKQGEPPLELAVRRGFLECVKFLVKNSASPHCQHNNGGGAGPMHHALQAGKYEIAMFLAAEGACTHRTFVSLGEPDIPLKDQPKRRALAPLWCLVPSPTPKTDEMRKWANAVAKPEVQKCDKCGLDTSKEGEQRFFAFREQGDPVIAQCSNPSCRGELATHTKRVTPNGSVLPITIPPRLKKCARCLAVAYCSESCQREHWRNGHREVCKAPLT